MPTNRIEKHWIAPALSTPNSRWQDDDTLDSELPHWLQRAEQFLVDHPETTVIAALAIGLTLGWLGKRK